jgi:two-component system cell cycle sensor histidine kinase/response regulator CckA
VATLYASGEFELDESGQPVRMLGTLQDISERRQVEQSLRRSEDLYRLVTGAVPALIAYVDSDYCYQFANRRFEEWTGQKRSHIYGRTVREVLGDAAYANLGVYIDKALSGEEVTFEAELPYGPTGRRHVQTTYVPHVGDEGEILGFFALVQDITEHKRVEEEQRVIGNRLQEKQKIESLGLLAGGIAHDFNNMLTGIMGNSGLVRMEMPAESPLVHYLDEIETTARNLSDFCKQMLAYSGMGRFVLQTLSLNTIIEDMMQMLQFSTSKKAVLTCDLSDDLPGVEGDASQMRQIIMNFTINASEAIGDKGGNVTLRTGTMQADRAYLNHSLLGTDLEPGDYVFIEVRDDGSGISEDVKARIFDPFYTTKFRGRGLGLAAVLGIVRGHKGALNVYSKVGKGTTLRALLPYARGQVTAAETAVRAMTGPETCSGTVLVVDDERTVRMVAERGLQSMGLTVVLAENGREGLARFSEQPDLFAAVVLDLTMPHIDGVEAYREIRKLKPTIPVLLMSGFNEQEAISQLTGEGVAGFLQKPFGIEELKETVRQLLTTPGQTKPR